MAEQQTPPTKERLATRKQDMRGADTAPVFYANYLGVLATKGDVKLRFGHIDEADAEKLVSTVVASVYVSPDHLIDFLILLTQKASDYARMFPDSGWPRLAAALKKSSE